MVLLLLALSGALAGMLGALVGVGGGVVLVPVLTLGFGLSLEEAVPVSLLCVVASSCAAAASYVEQRQSDIRLALTLELATVGGAIIGGLVAGMVAPSMVALGFGLFTFYVSLQMLFALGRNEPEPTVAAGPVRNLALGVGGSFVAGGLSALLGVGGGPLKVPLMRYGMGVPFRVAAATSNLMIGVTGAASVAAYAARGQFHLGLAAPLVVGVFGGALLGSRWMPRIPVVVLKRVFAIVLQVVAVEMLWKGGIGGMAETLRAPEPVTPGTAAPDVAVRGRPEAGERAIARVLRAGAWTSSGLFLGALLLGLADSPSSPQVVFLTQAGASLLLVTPVARLVVAGTALGLKGEWRYALAALGVLGLLVVAVASGRIHSP